MATLRNYYRRNDDPKGWWHWRPKCEILRAKGDSKQAGDVWSTITGTSHPTSYALCPGCLAEDKRIRTGDRAVFVKRNKYPSLNSTPLTEGLVRRDEALD